MSKSPRFFCDNCSHEVEADTKACPHCGKFFASVRCPSCGFSGEDSAFAAGCPSCGYSAPPAAAPSAARMPEQKAPAQPLPLWVYIFSVCAFIGICVVLFFILTR